jgi:DNA-binding PadR family transcriptional regulator
MVELSPEIAVRNGERKPGPGKIYSALENLKEMGFIFDQEKGGNEYNL